MLIYIFVSAPRGPNGLQLDEVFWRAPRFLVLDCIGESRLKFMRMMMIMFLRIALHQTPVALFLDFVFQLGAKNLFLPQNSICKTQTYQPDGTSWQDDEITGI